MAAEQDGRTAQAEWLIGKHRRVLRPRPAPGCTANVGEHGRRSVSSRPDTDVRVQPRPC